MGAILLYIRAPLQIHVLLLYNVRLSSFPLFYFLRACCPSSLSLSLFHVLRGFQGLERSSFFLSHEHTHTKQHTQSHHTLTHIHIKPDSLLHPHTCTFTYSHADHAHTLRQRPHTFTHTDVHTDTLIYTQAMHAHSLTHSSNGKERCSSYRVL